jgi:tRNA threonylcarbamoyladenosine biosynthesis protein TsaE
MNKMMAKYITKNHEDTARVAQKLARVIIKKGIQKHAVVVGLYGELGAGKTTFVKAFARELGIKETVVSPTFILERVYILPKPPFPFRQLVHIDAYRISEKETLAVLSWGELVSNPNVIMIIEWADNIKKFLPKDAVNVFFEHTEKETREISVMKHKT